jgi:branched-chain amino acid transport system ATP-binding protein
MLLKVDNLHVSYGEIRALNGVSISVPHRGFVGVLGSNGAGKSTLLKAISGLVASSAGAISFNGSDLTRRPPHEVPGLGVAHVPEGRRVFPSLPVADNLLLGAYARRGKEDRDDILASVLDLFPRLKERSKQLAGSLSGGEQQMLAVGRALMLRPTLLMLDEPSLGLAPIVVDEMFSRLADIHQEWEVAVLLVEQNAARALELVEEVVVLENGRKTLAGPKSDLEGTADVRRFYLGLK